MNVKDWPKGSKFHERVDDLGLHELHFQHVRLCRRRAWMYLHNINFAQWYGLVKTGTAKHITSYARDKSTEGLFGLAPDRVDWQNRVVYENKGSSGAADACNDQTAFYALMLSLASGQEWRGITHILSTKQRREVPLDEKQLNRLWDSSTLLAQLALEEKVPSAHRIGLCKACSFSGFCGMD
ncbi:Dna2/Cas4 domain-containing protein [Desulfocicer niacini]